MRFSYTELPEGDGSVYLPLIKLHFGFGDYYCLVDSGADFSYMHTEIGEAMGITVREGERGVGRGVTGREFTAYFHDVECIIGDYTFTAPVGFSYQLGMPFGLLGRKGFFEEFTVVFHERERYFDLLPVLA